MMIGMEISVIGISHHTAAVEARETLALGPERTQRLLQRMHGEDILDEAMLLDTCNRTELYFVAGRDEDIAAYLLDSIVTITNTAPAVAPGDLYRRDGRDAAGHLFRVAAGLDSQVLGEDQILGQVKAAYRLAVNERTAGFLLNKLLHWSFRVGKRVRTETQLAAGPGSIAQAAAALGREALGSLAGRTVLLLGAGETGELTARALIAGGADRLLVANRHPDRARAVAETLVGAPADEDGRIRCPALRRRHSRTRQQAAPPRIIEAEAADLNALARLVPQADLIVASTASPEPILTEDAFRADAGNRPVVIIDIAVPRDVDPAIGRRPNVRLHNIDDLDRIVAAHIDHRREEIPRAERIVAEEVDRFDRWMSSRRAAPTIRMLRRRLNALREQELRRYGKRFDDEVRGEVDRFTRSMLNKLLHDPMTHLHELAHHGDTPQSMAAADTIRRLFDLDSQEQEG